MSDQPTTSPTPAETGCAPATCSAPSADDATDYKETWEKRWKEVCTNPDGSLNLDQIMRELSDYAFMLEQVPEVYCTITGGLLSKPNYYASTIISVYEEEVQKRIEQYEKDKLEDAENFNRAQGGLKHEEVNQSQPGGKARHLLPQPNRQAEGRG